MLRNTRKTNSMWRLQTLQRMLRNMGKTQHNNIQKGDKMIRQIALTNPIDFFAMLLQPIFDPIGFYTSGGILMVIVKLVATVLTIAYMYYRISGKINLPWDAPSQKQAMQTGYSGGQTYKL